MPVIVCAMAQVEFLPTVPGDVRHVALRILNVSGGSHHVRLAPPSAALFAVSPLHVPGEVSAPVCPRRGGVWA